MTQPHPPVEKYCLVTGASRGIGHAICETLAASGFGLVRWARSPLPPLAATGPVIDRQVDVSDPQAVAEAADDLVQRGVRLHGLVLNAGSGRWTPLAALDADQWRQTLAVNLDGAFHVLKGALGLLDDAAGPTVVGLLSDSALYAFPDRAAYAASKAGLRALLETARLETRARGIRFSLIYPSRVDTHFAGSHERGRPGLRPTGLDPQRVADLVAFILAQPPPVEIREVHLAAMTDSFGPYNDKKEQP